MNFLSLRLCLWPILRFIRSGLFDRLLRFVIIRRLVIVGLLIVISSRPLFRAIVSVALPVIITVVLPILPTVFPAIIFVILPVILSVPVILTIAIPSISSVAAIIATGSVSSVVLILRNRCVGVGNCRRGGVSSVPVSIVLAIILVGRTFFLFLFNRVETCDAFLPKNILSVSFRWLWLRIRL